MTHISLLSAGKRAAVALCILILAACSGEEPGGGERIREFTEGMRWAPGFVPFYYDGARGHIYLLLDESNQELLYQGSLPRGIGSNDIGLDRGQLGERAALVRFEPAGERVLLREVNLRYRADTENAAEQRSVEQAFASSVLWGFPVVARDGGQRLVDATEFLLRDTRGGDHSGGGRPRSPAALRRPGSPCGDGAYAPQLYCLAGAGLQPPGVSPRVRLLV